MTETERLVLGVMLGVIAAWALMAIVSFLWTLVAGPRTHVNTAQLQRAMHRAYDGALRTALGGSKQTPPDPDKGR